ncbi:MAG TPA: helix-turn-helix transcriptional regulator [Rubrobacter sp.]|nr:helix-turn-helix transcriptional regulator [Rubrobacter sp.]
MREVREDLGMQRTVLARRVGVAENTIYRIETGKRTPSIELLESIARELRTEPAELLRELGEPVGVGKAGASETGPPQARREDLGVPAALAAERRLGYLQAWRAFAWKLERCWNQDPPKTSREIAPLFEVMSALMDEGVFEFSKAASLLEHTELMLFMEGLRDLNKIADNVQAGEEAEERRAAFRVIQDQIGA